MPPAAEPPARPGSAISSFRPLTRRSLADEVFDQLVRGIVDGDLPQGDALPSERRLATAFGVSRPAVREALQRLAQAGMVSIRQGDGTTVRAWHRTAGPELLPRLLVGPDGTLDLRVARSLLEVRQAVGPDVAALAALRHGDDLAGRLRPCLATLRDADDAVVLQQAALELWDALVDAGDNVAFRLMFNALAAAYEPVMAPLAEVLRGEVSDADAYQRLADAVLDGDAEGASAAARDLLAAGTGAVLAVLEQLLDAQDDDQPHDGQHHHDKHHDKHHDDPGPHGRGRDGQDDA